MEKRYSVCVDRKWRCGRFKSKKIWKTS